MEQMISLTALDTAEFPELSTMGRVLKSKTIKAKVARQYPLDPVVHDQRDEFRALIEAVAALAFGTALGIRFVGLKHLALD